MPSLLRFRARARHGVSLLAVTVLSLAAATVAVLVLRQVLAAARSSTAQAQADEARELAGAALADVVAEVESDPTVPLRQVLADEQPRRCVLADPADPTLQAANPDHPVYTPGMTWPAACGPVWDYPTAPVDGLAVHVSPPGPDGPVWQIDVLADAGAVVLGRSATLAATDAGRFAIATVDDLDLDLLDGATLDGGIYTAGRLLLPRTAAVSFGTVQLIGEDGLVGVPDTTAGVRYYATPPEPGADPAIRDPRTVVDATASAASLGSAVDLAAAVACTDVDVRPVTVAATDVASQLCLEPGGDVIAADGSTVTLPSDAAGWLLLPGRSSPDTVDVYSRTVPLGDAGCPARCDLRGLAGSAVASGTHPGSLSGWTLVGTLRQPASGMIGTSGPVQVGLCGDGFVDGLAACDTDAPARPLTVVAGAAGGPADLWVGGPVANVGLVATGDVVVPFWAATPGSTVTVDAQLVAAGTVRSHPDRAGTYGAGLELTGTLVASTLQQLAGWDTVAYTPVLDGTVPPHLPGLHGTLSQVRVQDLTSQQACGERACTDW